MGMTAGIALISVEEYLSTEYKPSCDYIDGVLRQKNLPTYNHSSVQLDICNLVNRFAGFRGVPEQTVLIRKNKYLVPDVAVQSRTDLQRPYPTSPVHLCVEILSPDDRFVDAVSKCGEYHDWGVQYCWIVDPDNRRAWQYNLGGRPDEVAPEGDLKADPILVKPAEIFQSL